MSESLEQRALRIRKEVDEEIDALGGLIFQCARYERSSMEWREAITVFMDEFARRLMAGQGEPVACKHEPFQGFCVHCNAPYVLGRCNPVIPPAAQAPQGMVRVPREPTIEQLERFCGHGLYCGDKPYQDLVDNARADYKARIVELAAAPAAPPQEWCSICHSKGPDHIDMNTPQTEQFAAFEWLRKKALESVYVEDSRCAAILLQELSALAAAKVEGMEMAAKICEQLLNVRLDGGTVEPTLQSSYAKAIRAEIKRRKS